MQKRGQATLLIILGIIVVFVVVGLYAFREDIFKVEISEALLIPEQAQEIHDLVSVCVEEVALEGLDLLGVQGGYVNIPDDPIPDLGVNEFSNSLEIFEGGDLKTVYWYYESANNVDKSQIPSLEMIEGELAGYMNENLADCVDDSGELLFEYSFVSEEVFSTVEILDEKVIFDVVYPIHIEVEDFEFDFPNFYFDVDVPLGEMYESAVEIMEKENSDFIFEELTYDMLVLNEDVPLSWGGFDCSTEEWEFEEVKEAFKQVLYQNVLAIKVKNTNYDVKTESDENYFELELLDDKVDLSASVYFSSLWPLYMNVAPVEDGKMKEDSLTSGPLAGVLRNFFCLHSYNFVYDIKYPLLINLFDDESEYSFQFATMVVLDNNQPRENVLGVEDYSDDSIICGTKDKEVRVYPLGVDSFGNLIDLEDVDISYQCITTICDIDVAGGFGLFPRCFNGKLIGEKEGYYQGEALLSTLDSDVGSVVLEKLYELDYEIKVVDLDGNERNPSSDETIYISLSEEDGYAANAFYPDEFNEIELIPGSYSVFGTVVKEQNGVSVNGQSFETCVSVPVLGIGGIFGLEKDQCYDVEMDDIDLDSMMTGGLEWQWEVDREGIENANKVVFYVTEAGEAKDVEGMEEVYSVLQSGFGMKEPELK